MSCPACTARYAVDSARQPSGIAGDQIQSVTLDPEPECWPGLVRTIDTLDDRARHFRDQLGLPTDKSIIMSGHQAGLWHPGILAKLFASNAIAGRTHAAVAWLVVDMDEHTPGRVRLPAHDADGKLHAIEWDAAGPGRTGVALAGKASAPREPALDDGWSMPDQIRARVDAITDTLRAHENAPSLAAQMTLAAFDLLYELAEHPIVVHASQFVRTDLFREIIERAIADPAALRLAYNDAAGAIKDAGVRGLGERADGALELPLWRMDGPYRLPVYDTDLAVTPLEQLLPRGMLMTAMARLAGCDLFIHGTGGRAYEPINDAWFGGWMDATLAPFVTATADVTLDLEGDIVTDEQAAHARWRAHHARHHPGELGDDTRERDRDRLVRTIHDAPRGSPERDHLYRELHATLNDARRAHQTELRALDARARELAAAASERNLREDRSWSFALHDAEMLVTLRDEIARRL